MNAARPLLTADGERVSRLTLSSSVFLNMSMTLSSKTFILLFF